MGIAVDIAANLLIGGLLLALFARRRPRDQARLDGPAEALGIYRQHFPDADGTVTLASDQRAALVALRGGNGVGLVVRHARRWNARELQPGELRRVSAAGDVLTLSLSDFGWPASQVSLADPDTRTRWLARLQALAARGTDGAGPEKRLA
ncbi:MAG: hypothetical protein JSR67_02305 [Proteobacteria bacterium]|nr:hypothetical protein [Pseudomonadota bacterium]